MIGLDFYLNSKKKIFIHLIEFETKCILTGSVCCEMDCKKFVLHLF